MANEWRVARVKAEELELTLQNLDADGFQIDKIHFESALILVIACKALSDNKRKRFYPSERVVLRASNGRLVETQGIGQPLRAVGMGQSDATLFQLIRLDPTYGPGLVAFLQPGGLIISIADEKADKPLIANGPEVGGWQMFVLLPRSGGRVSIRTFDQKKFLRAEGSEALIVAKAESADEADVFDVESVRSSDVEQVGVILHW